MYLSQALTLPLPLSLNIPPSYAIAPYISSIISFPLAVPLSCYPLPVTPLPLDRIT